MQQSIVIRTGFAILFLLLAVSCTLLDVTIVHDSRIMMKWFGCCAISLAMAASLFLWSKQRYTCIRIADLAIVAFLLYILLTDLYRGDFSEPIAVRITSLGLLYVVFRQPIGKSAINVCFVILLAVCFIVAVWGIVQFVLAAIREQSLQMVVVGSFDNPAGLAVTLAFALPIGFHLLSLPDLPRSQRASLYVSLCVIILSILLSGSRTGWLSLLCSGMYTYAVRNGTTPEVLAYPLAALPLLHRMDTSDTAIGESVEEMQKLPEPSILLENVEVEGHRRYVNFCTFQAYDVEKDKELIIDKGEYTNTVADYLIEKGYEISRSDGESFEQFLDAKRREKEGLTLQPTSNTSDDRNSEKNVVEMIEGSTEIEDERSQYLEWLIEKSTINNYRTLWYIKDGIKNSTSPSTLPGFDIDLMDIKSIIVYDSPHSYMSNESVLRDFNIGLITAVQSPKYPFSAGLYVVEIHLCPGRKSNISWFKNTRQTTFDGYSPKVEYYNPQYPDGPIQGDADYRRTLYWNPEVKVSNGRAEVEFYNNSYTKSLHISAEGITSDGEFIVYDSDKPTN